MLKRIAVYPYKKGSKSAKTLASALSCKQIRLFNSHFNKWGHLKWHVINWGSTKCPAAANVLNPSNLVSIWSNKLLSFQVLGLDSKIRTPDWTTSPEVAKGWQEKGYLVVARNSLTGHSGYGIIIVQPDQELPQAPLYTKYVRKSREYRVHCMKGLSLTPFYVQKKAVKHDFVGQVNRQVQNKKNGFVYVHNNVKAPDDVLLQATKAFEISGLNFGAVDVIWSEKKQKAYVLEINTAPGLEGLTISRYTEALKLVL